MFIQEDYFRNIFNTVREAILILDSEMRVLSANRSFYTKFKVDPANTIGSLLYSLGNRQWDIPNLRVLLEEILPNNDTVDDYEIEHDFESIGRKTMLLNACKIREKKDDQPIILLAIEDITERKRLEELLTESEKNYRRIFDTANDGIVLLEKDNGTIIHANPAAANMLGYSEEEYSGKMLDEVGIPIDMSNFPMIMDNLNRNGIIQYDDVPVKTKSGEEIDTDIYLVDRARFAQCNIRDVSERKRKEMELLAALVSACDEKNKSEAIINSMGEGLSIQNTDFIITYQNKVQKDSMGDHVGECCYSAYENKDSVCEECSLSLAYRDGGIHKQERAITTGKETKYFEITASPLRDINGNIVAGIEVTRDVTGHKKLEAQLLHSQKMEAVGSLAGGIAHDFNNILNVIIGYSSMIQEKLVAGSPEKEQLTQVLIAADRAATLTKRLLAFSRKQAIDVKPVNVNELIRGLQKFLIRIFNENIEFRLDLTKSPLIVLVDAGQIEQVLMNLAVNARDAMPDGGSLIISTEIVVVNKDSFAAYGYGNPGTYALISVADTGQGIDAETQKKIFEPFFTTKVVGEGTGLGLAISYGIVKQHNGLIKVYSEPGQGSVFRIFLPLNEVAVSPDRLMQAPAAAFKGGTEMVLVAEDDASLRGLAKIVLESSGYTVITAKDGEDAITKFMKYRESISLVLLDMVMPNKSGKEVKETLIKVSPEIKILFTSGYTMDIVITAELTEPGFDFICKPYQSVDLLKKVREILDR